MKNKNPHRFYVYEYYSKTDNLIFYVGKGCGDRYRRISKYARSKDFLDYYHSHDCSVRIIESDLTNDEASALEIERIAYLRNLNHPLTNKTNGGEGKPRQKEYSIEQRQAFRERVLGTKNPNYGNHWSEQQKTEASRKRIESGLSSGLNNGNAKVIQCVETGEVFFMIKDAMEKYNIQHTGSITVCLKNPQRTAKGLHWRLISYYHDYSKAA